MRQRLGLVTLLACCALVVAPTQVVEAKKSVGKKGAKLKTLRQGSFKVKAPKGYKLTQSEGSYIVSGKDGRVVFTRYDTDMDPGKAADSLIKQLGATQTGRTVKDGVVTANLDRSGGGKDVLVVKSATAGEDKKAGKKKRKGKGKGKKANTGGPALDVRLYGTGKQASASASSIAKKADIDDVLAQIAQNAVGAPPLQPAPPVVKQQLPVAGEPMVTVKNKDNSATAQLPQSLSTNVQGIKGSIEVYSDKGEVAFGIPAIIGPLGFGMVYPVTSDKLEIPEALVTLWPRIRALIGGQVTSFQVTSVSPAGLVGFTSSCICVVQYTINGRAMTAAFLAGSGGPYGDGTWLLYYSMVACPDGLEFNPICQQLPAAWASWDPSPSWAERIANTNTAVRATTEQIRSVNAYRQAVAEEAAEKWDAYIRQ